MLFKLTDVKYKMSYFSKRIERGLQRIKRIIADKKFNMDYKRIIIHASMNDKSVNVYKSFRLVGIKIR
ncbi:MAG: hypothetical protein Q8T04_11515 [Bacteroidota bacterium]|nr:hypothetical protein [Bacteroidota bacterium]